MGPFFADVVKQNRQHEGHDEDNRHADQEHRDVLHHDGDEAGIPDADGGCQHAVEGDEDRPRAEPVSAA